MPETNMTCVTKIFLGRTWRLIGMVTAFTILQTTTPLAEDFNAKDPTRFWNAYKRATDCEQVMFARGGKTRPNRYNGRFDAKVAARIRPIAPLGNARSCALGGPSPVPQPIVNANGGEGAAQDALHVTVESFLNPAIARHRRSPNANTAAPLLKFLSSWANSNALSQGTKPSNDNERLDFSVQMVIPAIVIAFGDTARYMSIENRIRIGTWVSGLVEASERSRFPDRQDNKAYLADYIALLWGITTQDGKLIKRVEKSYRNALIDMRPDGSMPVDSSREGAGLHYHNRSTLMLVAIASVARRNGLNWYDYRVNGRSVHSAVQWSIEGLRNPAINRNYAISCQGGGNPAFSIAQPDTSHRKRFGDGRSMLAWVPLYAAFSGNRDGVKRTRSTIAWSTSAVHEKTLGPLPCVLNVN